MPSKILVEQIAHTNDTSAIDIDSSGNMVLQKDLKFNATAAIKNSAGNAILQESGGNVTLSNVRLPASGGISDSSGNAILTESAGTVTVGTAVSIPSSAGGVPAGAIMSFAMSSAPTGWVVCNGAEYAIADYGDLHTAIGTTWGALTNGSGGAGSTHFRVPDLRGAFLRGTGSHGTNDMANGNDFAGPSVGGFENDQFQNFKTDIKYLGTRYGISSDYSLGSIYNGIRAGGGIINGFPIADDQGSPRTGDETRPFNAGINYCIKY